MPFLFAALSKPGAKQNPRADCSSVSVGIDLVCPNPNPRTKTTHTSNLTSSAKTLINRKYLTQKFLYNQFLFKSSLQSDCRKGKKPFRSWKQLVAGRRRRG